MSRTIALLTDFGLTDAYVGVMKGVLLGIEPSAQLVDLTHAVQPQNVRQAAFTLLNSYRYFPGGTVFLVVVDPGVGSERKPLAVQSGGYCFVAPDNGVLSYVLHELGDVESIELASAEHRLPQVSHTFHGRDVFAPAAAYLAAGVALTALGVPLANIKTLPEPTLEIGERRVMGEVIHIDHFGNIITTIGQWRWASGERLTLQPRFGGQRTAVHVQAAGAMVRIGGQVIAEIRRIYAEAPRGGLLALIGSSSYLEIAVNQGNAAARLDVAIGDPVELQLG